MTLPTLFLHPESDDSPLPQMVGTHPLMREVYRMVRQVAPKAMPVAIVGETGVGKELVARALHVLSPRRDAPFIAVNAAALPETLFESELFGHERGAFSDARTAKRGLIEAADGGSLFLDELAAVPLECQAKLLRTIEEGAVRRVGGLDLRKAAPRWIVSCQAADGAHIVGSAVRADLWYRATGVLIVIPPLRDRASDIVALAAHFLAVHDLTLDILESSALEVLTTAFWPGNVRQLERVLGRVVLKANGSKITAMVVRHELSDGEDGRLSTERTALYEVLVAHTWNLRRAAQAIGISRGTLYRRMEALGLERPPRVSQVF